MNELDDSIEFGDLLKNWPNDDILLTGPAQNLVKKKHPDLFPIFDWPEIRNEFKKHNEPALEAKALSLIHI